MRVAICIATYQRPVLLRRLLTGLSRLAFQKTPQPDVKAIVVDNDPRGSARDVCQNATLPFAIGYVIEPRRGIAHVRNRAMSEARAADVLAFIDDDESPSPQWLDELIWTQSEYQADIVAGPVQPEFVGDVPSWIKKGGFFDRQELRTGTRLEKCGAGNVLLSRKVITRVPRFDERFQLTGGEDTHFFLRAHRAGFSIVWSQLAVAYEAIAANRANLPWILHRGYQSGNSWVLCELSLDGSLSVRVARFCKASVHILHGIASIVPGLYLGAAALVKALRKVYWGAGMLAGLFGQRYLAYEHESPHVIKPSANMNGPRPI